MNDITIKLDPESLDAFNELEAKLERVYAALNDVVDRLDKLQSKAVIYPATATSFEAELTNDD